MPLLNIVIDLYHGDPVDETSGFHQMRDAGIRGVIHKATQGLEYTDPEHESRRHRARSVDLYWGAYHFGVGGDGVGQADFFLRVVNPSPTTLLALDWEPNPTDLTMKRAEAEAFVERIQGVTGRYPLLYSGQSFLWEQLGSVQASETLLSQCSLWIARYSSRRPQAPPAFSSWVLWQYTDGSVGPYPHRVAGVGRCDRDKFKGDEVAFNTFWGR